MGRTSRTGGVRPAGDRIIFDFTFQGERCRPTLDLKPTPANMKYAARLATEIREKIRHGAFVMSEFFPHYRASERPSVAKKKFSEYVTAYLKGISALSPSTQHGYEKITRQWLTWFGELPISSILHSDVVTAIGAYPWQANKTRNNVLSVGKRIFALAVRDGILASNPVDGVEFLQVQQDEPDPLTLKEVELLLNALDQRFGPEIRDYYEFAIFTGLRPSEQIELCWDNVDELRGTIRIDRSRVRGIPTPGMKTGIRNQDGQPARTMSLAKRSTKTHKARDVDLNERAAEVMARQKTRTRLAGGVVFINPHTGRPWADESAQGQAWRAGIQKAKIRHRAPYQARHTCATMLLMAGANPAWAAAQLGHAKEIFFRKYARWIDDDDRNRTEVSKVNAFVGNSIAKSIAK